MSTAAPLQNTAAKSQRVSKSSHAGLLLQRKCACGGSPGVSGECMECQGKRLQRKLAIGLSNDPLEMEADRVADQVLAAPAHSAVSGVAPRIQRFTGQTTGDAGTAPASVDRVLSSLGRPLEPTLRQDMEQRFGHDFSTVRIHSGGVAEQSVRDVNAKAYTVGNKLVFGAGRFAPGTYEGRRLIAHELTHVVQQSRADGIRVIHGNAALGLLPEPHAQFLQRQEADGGSARGSFDDDPLSAGGFDDKDPTLRTRPGPVRTTLIRPRAEKMTKIDGQTYSRSANGYVEPGAWIQGFLSFFNFWLVASIGSTQKYAFLGASRQPLLDFTQVIDTVIKQGALDGQALERNAVISGILAHLPAPAPGPGSSLSFYLTLSVVRTVHAESKKPLEFSSSDPAGGQAALQITFEWHRPNQSGPEFSWVGQLAAFADAPGPDSPRGGPFRLQSAFTGFQAAWVFAFLSGALQVAPIAQVLRGFARAQQTSDGLIKFVPTGQVAGGGQIVYVVEGTQEHLQIGGQAAAAYTSSRGATPTIDLAPSIFMQWKF